MSIRISKATKEFNVSHQTITEHLNKVGLGINSETMKDVEILNTKLSAEQYDALKKEFSADKDLRNKTEKIFQERHKEKKQSAPAAKKAQPEEVYRTASSKPATEFKPLGKIELDAKGNPIKRKPAEPVKKVEAPAEPAMAEAEAEAKPEVAPATKEEIKPEVKAEGPVAKVEVAEAMQNESVEAKTEAVQEEVNSTKPESSFGQEVDGVFRVNPVTEMAGPKVLGKIDLSAINQSTHPRKKSKEERRKEREKKPGSGTVNAQGGDKRKRTRIGSERVDINAAAQQSGGSKQGGGSRPGGNQGNNNRQQQQQQGGGGKRKDRNRKSPIAKPELTEEEVAKQIKDTLARLTSKTKTGKGAKYRKEKRDSARDRLNEQMRENDAESRVLKLTEFVTANELASMMDVPVTQIIGTCMSIGIMVSINQRMDAETINLVAEEFGFKTEYVSAEVSEAVIEEEDNEEDLQPRAPIVTVMGHVDHGKTSLLDYIRKANVIAGEAGGITQHIGAYNVTLEDGRHITFLDTPGHEAFTAMRARGAQATDIAIIIIAADDDIMPQTKEAINHAVAANVPIVFAINKIDKPNANPDKIKEGLANLNFLIEEWGGKYQSQDISAKQGIGVKELLEKVLLEAEMLELKANPNRKATGTIVESSLDKGRGYVANILVSNGTLHQGDIVLAGIHYGRVKALFNERNQRVDAVAPSQAAILLGFNGAPQAGDTFHVMDTEQEVREIANKREQLQREQGLRTQKRLSLEEVGRRIALGSFQELNIIVKGDVDGSVEALSDSLIRLSTDKIAVNVISKGVGQISENDVSLAAASDAVIIGFQVRPSMPARRQAEQSGVEIRLYSIIYDAIEEVKDAMEGMLEPIIKEEITATIEVRQVYNISKVGIVAGAYVIDGKVKRSDKARLIRDGIVIFTGDINDLKRFKDDVKEVSTNFECGISLTGCNDMKEGDTIETFQEVEVKQKL